MDNEAAPGQPFFVAFYRVNIGVSAPLASL